MDYFFKSLVEQEIVNPGDESQMGCLWFCFAKLLQYALDKVKEHWNTHLIRGSRHDSRELKHEQRRPEVGFSQLRVLHMSLFEISSSTLRPRARKAVLLKT